MTRRTDIDLPCPPRCLRREEAARYVGISPSKFSALVASEDMPRPIHITESLQVWDRRALDAKIDELVHGLNDSGGW